MTILQCKIAKVICLVQGIRPLLHEGHYKAFIALGSCPKQIVSCRTRIHSSWWN